MTADAGATPGFVPLRSYREYPVPEMIERSRAFASELQRRRTARQFSPRPVPRGVIDACIEAAGTAPSGAHQQPWHFVVVSSQTVKRAIREAAERAEAEFCATAPPEWLATLAPLGTDKHKPYLETAPYLIAVFAQRYGRRADGTRQTHNSVMESVGIAAGFSLAARHHSGLATLAHTPNPMGFLNEILERAVSERAIMLVVTAFRLRTLSCRTSRERLSRISRDSF